METQDRFHFVAQALGVTDHALSAPLRLVPFDAAKASSEGKRTLRFIHDFSSPWSFMGSRQVGGMPVRGPLDAVVVGQ